MAELTRSDIVAGLRVLGLESGDRVLVHSSLVALGTVDGGADSVVDALLGTVGPEGLVIVPTFYCAGTFDRRTSITRLGAIPERLWRRPGAVRSLHPTHSVAAVGKGAAELISGHEHAPTAYGPGTPYHRLAAAGGKVLLLGVDQDRNTTLHTAEALVRAPYLKDIEATYIADDGAPVTIPVAAMAGPHRDFLRLDRLFLDRGVMRIGRIGRAMCRLLDARAMVETAVEALRRDPAAVLCENPACGDCVAQRARIKAAWLAAEPFRVAAVAGDISVDLAEVVRAILGQGIDSVEVTPDEIARYGDALRDTGTRIAAIRAAAHDQGAMRLAVRMGVPLVVPAATREDVDAACSLEAKRPGTVLIENAGAPSVLYASHYRARAETPPLAFNPAQFAAAGEKPFLGVFSMGALRKHTAHVYLDDGTHAGRSSLLGLGNGEVKEILSMLRCRGFDGTVTLRSHRFGVEGFREAAAAFWRILDPLPLAGDIDPWG